MLLLSQYELAAQRVTLSRAEWLWAIGHPIAAIKVKKIKNSCDLIYSQLKTSSYLDKFENGGTLDAYRHVFYMAAFAQKVEIKKLKKLGKAHEKTNYRQFKKSDYENTDVPDSLSSVMDLLNNEVGLILGKENYTLNRHELNELVLLEINHGRAIILKRNKIGEYLKCDEAVIHLDDYKGIWFIPKCLVRSDYQYP